MPATVTATVAELVPAHRPAARRHRVRVAGVLVAGAALLAGCGTGFDAQTNIPYAPTNGGQADQGNLQVRNVQVVGGPGAELIGAINNTGQEPARVTSITVGDTDVSLPGGGLTIQPGTLVTIGSFPGATQQVVLPTFDRPIGRKVDVVFDTQPDGKVTVPSIVVSRESLVAGS